jgi:hypothetical protein
MVGLMYLAAGALIGFLLGLAVGTARTGRRYRDRLAMMAALNHGVVQAVRESGTPQSGVAAFRPRG